MGHAAFDIRPVDPTVIERVANILGNASASRAVLVRGAQMADPVYFETTDGDFLVIERAAFLRLTAPSPPASATPPAPSP
jgi:hypothetical protein